MLGLHVVYLFPFSSVSFWLEGEKIFELSF